jgi:hypothetical protein
MPTPMTPRERALTALRGDMPDQIPFLCYTDMIPPGPARQRLHELGLAAFDRIEPYRIRRNAVTVETRQIRDETYPAVLTTYHTPIGTLTQKQIVGPGYGSLWTKEYLIKRPEDYAVFEFILRDAIYEPDIDGFLATDRAYGENGLAVPRAADPPVQYAWRRFAGLERFFLDWYDCRDEVMRVLNALAESNRQIWQIVANVPGEFCGSGGNISAETIGPALFRELVLPHFEAEAAIMGPAGKRTLNHMDGRIRVLLDVAAESPVDIIEAFNPKPDGDVSVAEARAAWPGKVLSINFPSSVHLAAPERIREMTIDLLRQAAPGQGFLMGITENVPAQRMVESYTTIAQTLNQFGACPLDADALPRAGIPA